MDNKAYISIQNLCKEYPGVEALKNINFDVNRNELFGLIGPDGAGKTSLMRIVTTLLVPGSGSVKVNGLDVVADFKKLRREIGYMPGSFSLYQDLSIKENLDFFASIFDTTIDENYDLIKPIYSQIEKFKNRRAGKLSGGMKQKLALCCALVHNPLLLVLDEPTTGVDVVSRKEFWDILEVLKQYGKTILVSTPYMDEAALCDRIALMNNGEILKINSPQEIQKAFNRKIFGVRTNNMYYLLQDLKSWEYTYSSYASGQYAHFVPSSDFAKTDDLEIYLAHRNHLDIEIKPLTPEIEDCFIDLMKQK